MKKINEKYYQMEIEDYPQSSSNIENIDLFCGCGGINEIVKTIIRKNIKSLQQEVNQSLLNEILSDTDTKRSTKKIIRREYNSNLKNAIIEALKKKDFEKVIYTKVNDSFKNVGVSRIRPVLFCGSHPNGNHLLKIFSEFFPERTLWDVIQDSIRKLIIKEVVSFIEDEDFYKEALQYGNLQREKVKSFRINLFKYVRNIASIIFWGIVTNALYDLLKQVVTKVRTEKSVLLYYN
ncbi:hypothetical protein [Clostridium scatologenes]|uniref:Uncharacterized protein n=1 Tax=Clostridium scatologenes TaxID=1548 RepID=A0A0E3K3V8_CLOSL|nr:hypothetical protein [Clostridium scatologenes]AKA71958.1 hypothetical protein CSCA_4833 [Clostridium scatologenes]